MSLPRKPQTREGMAPRHARVLLGAPVKVGKTTLLAAWSPATTVIIDTHNGTRLLDGEHYVSHVHDWPAFVANVDEIVKGGHPFQTVGLDLVNDLWRFCDLHYGKRNDGMQIPASGADDYGKSLAKARTAFNGQIGRLLTSPVGIWFVTHLREKTNKTGELVVYVPDLDKNVHGYIMGAADFVWLAENDRGRRIVHTEATPYFEAGSRVALPSPLPMVAGDIARAMDRALNPGKYEKADEKDAPYATGPDPTLDFPAEEEPPAQHVEDFERDENVSDLSWAAAKAAAKAKTNESAAVDALAAGLDAEEVKANA